MACYWVEDQVAFTLLRDEAQMLTNLKRILLTQYIGAMITALVAVQGILAFIQVVILAVSMPLQSHSSVMQSRILSFDWNVVLMQAIRCAIHLAAAGLLIKWLYLDSNPPVPVTIRSEQDEPGQFSNEDDHP